MLSTLSPLDSPCLLPRCWASSYQESLFQLKNFSAKGNLKVFAFVAFRFVIFQRMRKKTGAPAFNHLSGCPLFPAFQESLTSLLAFGFLDIYFCNLFRGFLSYGTFAWVISFVGLQEAFLLQMGAPEVCRGVASRPCYLHSTIHNNNRHNTSAIQNYLQWKYNNNK